MALGDSYALPAELKSYLKIPDTDDDAELTNALAAASRGIEKHTGRQFNQATTATARLFETCRSDLAVVDDFHTATDLVIKTDAGNGSFGTTWVASSYELRPLNGMVDGEAGWPFYRIKAVGASFPTGTGRASLQVTAQWGWAAVPAPVKQACIVLAAETFKLKDAPFGVAGIGDYGMIRVRQNPLACKMLAPYVRTPVKAA